MFKLFVKLMMFLLVLAMAGPFVMKRPDGRPVLSLSDLALPKLEIPASVSALWQSFTSDNAPTSNAVTTDAASQAAPGISWSKEAPTPKSFVAQAGVEYPRKDGTYYRYQDSKGIWQFSDAPQVGSMNYVSTVDPNANVIQSLNKEKIDDALGRTPPPPPPDQDKKEQSGMEMPNLLPTTVPVAEIPNLIQQAKDVQTLVNERTKALEQSRY